MIDKGLISVIILTTFGVITAVYVKSNEPEPVDVIYWPAVYEPEYVEPEYIEPEPEPTVIKRKITVKIGNGDLQFKIPIEETINQ